MFVQCKGCSARLSYNPKRDKPLGQLACPHCGQGFRKIPPDLRAQPVERHEMLVFRFQDCVARLETCLHGLAQIAPTIGEISNCVQQLRELPQLENSEAP